MNKVFVGVVTVALVLLLVRDPQGVPAYLLEGTASGVTLALHLAAVYALWMGVLQVAADCGLDKALLRLYRPLLKRLFAGESDEAIAYVGLNLTANLLGLGSAATPVGIKAMEALSRDSERAHDNMILFFVLNVTAVQLLPGNVIAMRALAGSANAADITLPCLLSSVGTAVVGVGLCLAIRALRRGSVLRQKRGHKKGRRPIWPRQSPLRTPFGRAKGRTEGTRGRP